MAVKRPGVLPCFIGRVFVNGSAEPITHRMFPIEIEAIGAGFVRGVGKLITKRSGEWAVVSILLFITLKRNSLCLLRLETATCVFVNDVGHSVR